MSKNPGRRLLWSAALLLVCAAFSAPTARAKQMYVYDPDSLIHLSTDVVEGEIVRSYNANEIDLIDVKVTLVHKGGFEKGHTVVVRHNGYRKPKKGDRNREPLAVGDRLALFVVRATPTKFNLIPKDPVVYAPLPGGMRLVQGDHVYGFAQWDNPGPYVANVPSDPAKSKALPLAKEHHEVSILQRGFGTPQGRAFLLAKVMDAKEPMSARLRYASALHEVGPVYRSTFTEISANSHKPVGEADEGNSGYLRRIAKAALDNAKHELLCASLIRCLGYFGQGIVQNKPTPLMVDLHAAFPVLKELYDAKPSQELQFAIEKATAWDGSEYEKLKSPCGTFISILRPLDPAKYGKPEKRSLIFEYEYTTVLLSREAEVQPSVVLVHQGTLRKHVLPTRLHIRGWSTGGGSHSVELPGDLPAGRYHVFFQLGDGDKVIGTGHYFAADL